MTSLWQIRPFPVIWCQGDIRKLATHCVITIDYISNKILLLNKVSQLKQIFVDMLNVNDQ